MYVYLLRIQEAKCFEFTVQILPPPPEARRVEGGGDKKMFALRAHFAPPLTFISVYALALSHLHEIF